MDALLGVLGLAGITTPSGLIGIAIALVAKIVTGWISNMQRDQSLKELGAAQRAKASQDAAEAQEAVAARAGAAAATQLDADDGFMRKD